MSKTYEESRRLLEETNAVVEMHNYGAMMDLVGIDTVLVGSFYHTGSVILIHALSYEHRKKF